MFTNKRIAMNITARLAAVLLITTVSFTAATAQSNSVKSRKTSAAQLQEMSTELQELKALVYQQAHRIDALTDQLQQREQSATQAQSTATEAAASAASAQRVATQNAEGFTTLNGQMASLKSEV